MDVKTFESIKQKIETLKTQKARAEFGVEAISSSWQKNYNITTVEEAEALLASMDAEITETDGQLAELYTELEGLTNWKAI